MGNDKDYDELPEQQVTMNQVVAYNVAYFRKARGLTQEKLGERLEAITGKKWSKATMSAVERSWDGNRVRAFDTDDLFALSQALGYPVPALFLPPTEDGVDVRYLFQNVGQTNVRASYTKSYGTAEELLDQIFVSEDDDYAYPEEQAYTSRLEQAFLFYYGGEPAYLVWGRRPNYVSDPDDTESWGTPEHVAHVRNQVSVMREVLGGLERYARLVETRVDDKAGVDEGREE
ncbi:helix-turn-helix transcriptional regulator [Streptomyces sp. NPDC046984]|uniref:helix-turn-helix transcriptional regulator n=1 Tax=Streptomyces sp. NPDC046984 TaxID=3155138 RepID=UPI0033CF4E0D